MNNCQCKLALGTVQFGMPYGATNHSGQVSIKEIEQILLSAQKANVHYLDTAPSYGGSEKILGQCDLSSFSVISKLVVNHNDIANVTDDIGKSLHDLNIPKLYGLLLHREDDLQSRDIDKIMAQLLKLKRDKRIRKIGASFYSPDVALWALDRFDLDLIQVPLNALDQRFVTTGVLAKAAEKSVEVHARSAFLQGLLINPQNRPQIFQAHPDLLHFDKICQEQSARPIELALHYVKQHTDINACVVGCTSTDEFDEIIKAFKKELPTKSLPDLQSNDINLIDPSRWKL